MAPSCRCPIPGHAHRNLNVARFVIGGVAQKSLHLVPHLPTAPSACSGLTRKDFPSVLSRPYPNLVHPGRGFPRFTSERRFTILSRQRPDSGKIKALQHGRRVFERKGLSGKQVNNSPLVH